MMRFRLGLALPNLRALANYVGASGLLRENGTGYLLLENGNRLILEA